VPRALPATLPIGRVCSAQGGCSTAGNQNFLHGLQGRLAPAEVKGIHERQPGTLKTAGVRLITRRRQVHGLPPIRPSRTPRRMHAECAASTCVRAGHGGAVQGLLDRRLSLRWFESNTCHQQNPRSQLVCSPTGSAEANGSANRRHCAVADRALLPQTRDLPRRAGWPSTAGGVHRVSERFGGTCTERESVSFASGECDPDDHHGGRQRGRRERARAASKLWWEAPAVSWPDGN